MLSCLRMMTNLDKDLYRVATFRNWPLNYPSALNLAHAGFAYTGSGDAVHCYRCHCVIRDWREIDVPIERHKHSSPNCPLVASYSIPTHRLPPGSPITHPSEDLSSLQNPFPQRSLSNSSADNFASAPSQMPLTKESCLRADDQHLKLESQRFRTFDSWSYPHVSRRELARAGFFYTGIGDCVKCAFCSNILKQWDPGDVPFNEHKRLFPSCPFVRGENVGNIPEDRVMPDPPARVQQPKQSAVAPPVGTSYSPPGAELHKSKNSLNFDVNFADFTQRLHSFENVPLPKGQERVGLAEAGFHYVGPGDSVKCFQCGGVLKKWSETDKPWIEHAKWFPTCVFLLREKGAKFINDVKQKFSGSAVAVEPNFGSRVAPGNDDTMPKTSIEEAEQEESTSLKQEFLPSSVSTFSSASSGTMNVQLPVTYPLEMPSPSTSSSSSSSTTTFKPPKAANEEVASITKENEQLKDAILCKICMDERANTVFLPCGHLLCCERCAPAILDCPVCRGNIEGNLKVYIS